MSFLDTFWATMWGALGGAVVAAFAAWLFSLDLRRRDREDRVREREEDRRARESELTLNLSMRDDERSEAAAQRAYERELDAAERRKQSEADEQAREDDREFQRAEREEQEAFRERVRAEDREARLAERQEDRDHQYAMTMQRQWLELENAITRFAWADPRQRLDQFAAFNSVFTLTGATARGDDRKVFDILADLFTTGEMTGEVAIGLSSILAVYARDGMPASFAIDQIQEIAKERDAAKAAQETTADTAE